MLTHGFDLAQYSLGNLALDIYISSSNPGSESARPEPRSHNPWPDVEPVLYLYPVFDQYLRDRIKTEISQYFPLQ